MGFFDRLFGTSERATPRAAARVAPPSADSQAVDRYRYMMRTAPPETIEQAHQEAFAKLTPEQRREVLGEMTRAAPPGERAQVEATSTDDPKALARVATRTEIREPGSMERALSRPGMGLGGSLLSSFAMGFVGSMVAQSFFSAMGGFGDGGASDAASDEGSTAENDAADPADDANYGSDDGGFDGGDFDV